MKDANAQIIHQYLALQQIKLEVVTRQGVQMSVADFLSHTLFVQLMVLILILYVT